jgi:hypothetical protein
MRNNRTNCTPETIAVIPWAVMFPTPSMPRSNTKSAPSLAWWVADYRVRTTVVFGVPGDVPRVNSWKIEITTISLDK